MDNLPTARDQRPEPINNGWKFWKGSLGMSFDGMLNPDQLGPSVYREMLDGDETVFTGLELLKTSIVSQIGDYSHPDATMQQFVRDNLSKMAGNWSHTLGQVLTAIGYGFSCSEIVWRYLDGKIWLSELQTLPPTLVKLDIATSGPLKNRLSRVLVGDSFDKVELPRESVLLYSHNPQFGNPYGTSKLRTAYRNWFVKKEILKSWALCTSRYGSPWTIARVAGDSMSGNIRSNGVVMPTMEYVGEMVDSLGDTGSLVTDKNIEVQIVYPSRSFGGDFRDMVEYLNKVMYRSLQIPNLLVDSGDVGSYALGQEHKKTFRDSVLSIIEELSDVLVEQLVTPLLTYNFGPQDTYGEFQVQRLSPDDAKVLAEAAKAMRDAGILDTERLNDVNAFRSRTGLDLLEESDLQPQMDVVDLIAPEVVGAQQ